MNDTAKKTVGGIRRYLFTFIKWTFLSIVIGVICGCIGTIFHICVEKATEIRTDNSWIIFLLPFAGLFIVFLYTKTKQENDKGTNLVIESVRSAEKIPAIMAPLIFIATFLHICLVDQQDEKEQHFRLVEALPQQSDVHAR